jgi:hypothetical protein
MYFSQKMAGYVLYAIGIIGGVEGATVRNAFSIPISVVALIVIVAGSYLIGRE